MSERFGRTRSSRLGRAARPRAGAGLVALLAVVGCADAPTGPVATGRYGGTGIELEVLADETRIELDCAHGSIAARLELRSGRFDQQGVYIREHGGPVREDEVPDAQAARFAGTLAGDRLSLTIHLLVDEAVLGPYGLRRGVAPQLRKCL